MLCFLTVAAGVLILWAGMALGWYVGERLFLQDTRALFVWFCERCGRGPYPHKVSTCPVCGWPNE